MRRTSVHKVSSTSWQSVNKWYDSSVGEKGHYFHQHVVLPKSLELLRLKENSSLLDLGCGQGVLARSIPKQVMYQGVDAAAGLIDAAKEQNQVAHHHFKVADVTKPLIIQKKDFTHAACILAIQNMKNPAGMVENVQRHVVSGGSFLIVMNHPCFRIPRQSSWEVDPKHKTQFRRLDRYLTPLEIPITAHPGQKASAVTWSFHQPLSFYADILHQHGFVIAQIQEWSSDKVSVGKAAKMENRSRAEFPLFLALLAMRK